MKKDDFNRAEKILNSLDGLQKATAPDFFYTRLSGRMQNETTNRQKTFILLRPAFITASLTVILAINIFSISHFNKKMIQQDTVQSGNKATIETFAEAYNLVSTNVYE